MKKRFTLSANYAPAGDQPQAIEKLVEGINAGEQNQTLLGVTGSGKTFTMANIIERTGRSALIMAHNKTLAAQLYNEMREFFPNNAVEFFVSYYDYYQPEAYIARTDTYIEKDSAINEQIDLLRHSATRSMLERKDVIVIASVSCIYGLGTPEAYLAMTLLISVNTDFPQAKMIKQLIVIQYERDDISFTRGTFRVRGDTLDIFPAHTEDRAWRVSFFGDEIEEINEIDAMTGKKIADLKQVRIFANSHFITPKPTLNQAVGHIKKEMKDRVKYFNDMGQTLESYRIEQRTNFDIEMITETGGCKGIENYSRYLSGRNAGDPPPTLFEYLPKDALLFVDESHVTVPQVGGMYNGDRARKNNLIEHGFRLPSAFDNRPLKFDEWDKMRPQTVFVSATPKEWEIEKSHGRVIEQIIRPTGLLDPVCIIRPAVTQVDDLLDESKKIIANGGRILVTTLTKKMAENLSEYMNELGIRVKYIHSDINTLERIEILAELRRGNFDVLVGVNLLREGIDIPECELMAILDADKEGFLRSETSLVQTIGRAARNHAGRVILYADKITGSLERAMGETERRRKIQDLHNKKYNIIPTTIKKKIAESIVKQQESPKGRKKKNMQAKDKKEYLAQLTQEMHIAADNLEFETAMQLRNEIKRLT